MNLSVTISARKTGGRCWDARVAGGMRWLRSRGPVSGFSAYDACERLAASLRERYPEHTFTFARVAGL